MSGPPGRGCCRQQTEGIGDLLRGAVPCSVGGQQGQKPGREFEAAVMMGARWGGKVGLILDQRRRGSLQRHVAGWALGAGARSHDPVDLLGRWGTGREKRAGALLGSGLLCWPVAFVLRRNGCVWRCRSRRASSRLLTGVRGSLFGFVPPGPGGGSRRWFSALEGTCCFLSQRGQMAAAGASSRLRSLRRADTGQDPAAMGLFQLRTPWQ